jgi:hypothetical protein
VEILKSKDHSGQPFFVVGGQAVNAWAQYYLEAAPELARYLPFTSKDLDILGRPEDVWCIRKNSGWEWLPGDADPFQLVIGALQFIESPDSPPLLIEVLRRVQGATVKELTETAVELEISDRERFLIRVPDPVLLWAMKIENSVRFPQSEPNHTRQDVKHVRMLTIIVKAYIQNIIESNEFSDRDRVRYLCRLVDIFIKLSSQHEYPKFKSTFGLRLNDCFPESLLVLIRSEKKQVRQLARLFSKLPLES